MLFAAVAAVAWLTAGLRELRGEQAALREDLARAVALGEAWRAGNPRRSTTSPRRSRSSSTPGR